MNEKIWILSNSIRRDLATIAKIYDDLEQHPFTIDSDVKMQISIAYHLQNLYNTFEKIFINIIETFNNSTENITLSDVNVLKQMYINAKPLRPAVIDETAYKILDDLRRFRHIFRRAYGFELDSFRLQLVLNNALKLKLNPKTLHILLKKALALKEISVEQLNQFQVFLQKFEN